jgi:MFS family permease
LAEEKTETRKTIRTFAVASFLNDMGSDIISPVWPLFVTQVLKVTWPPGISRRTGGSLVSSLRRRRVTPPTGSEAGLIWAGYLCGGFSRLGYAASSVWQHLIPFRILDRAGKIRSAPRDAVIADISTDENRGRHFGLLRAMDNFGATAGILISIALFNVLGYRLLFALAAIPSIVGAALIVKNIKEPKTGAIRLFKGLSFKDIDRNLALYTVLNAVFAPRLHLFVPAPLRQSSGLKLHPFFYLVYSTAATFLSYPFGRLSDKIGRKPSYSWPSSPGPSSAPGSYSNTVCRPSAFSSSFTASTRPRDRSGPIAAELAPSLPGEHPQGIQMVIGLRFPASWRDSSGQGGKQVPFICRSDCRGPSPVRQGDEAILGLAWAQSSASPPNGGRILNS